MDKKLLYKLYYTKKLSYRDIGKLLSKSESYVKLWIKRYNFKPRTASEACKLRCKVKPQTNPGRKGMPKKPLYGKDNPAYKKGWWINIHGYKKICVDGEERLEHRHIWEQHYNKSIPLGHQIHHINRDKLDNRIENLQCLSNSNHQKLHNQPRNNITKKFIKRE